MPLPALPIPLLFLLPALLLQATSPWEVVQLEFSAESPPANPYAAIPLDPTEPDMLEVTFTGRTGPAAGRTLVLTGAWDGGSRWVVNAALPAAGAWAWESRSSDPGMDGRTGALEVAPWPASALAENPTRRGPVGVRKTGVTAGHTFAYADGTPFLWVGDTWWNWTKRGIHFETFQKLVDDRAAEGFTVGQLFVPGNGWGDESSLLLNDYTALDPVHVRRVERMIRYANSRGITVWIHGWWSRPDIDDAIGAEKLMRWWKYLVHRFGAYNVIWVLAGEYNMHDNGGFPLAFWNRLGRFIQDEDPYGRMISTHNTPPFWQGGADAPQWSTGEVLHHQGWLAFNQCQSGHGRYANEMIPGVVLESYRLRPPKPIVVTEPWYEFVEGNPTGMDVRLAIWGALMNGAAGHTYGGGHVWRAHLPESPGGRGAWPLEESFERDTLDYEGARSMAVMAGFFGKIPWWTMRPRPELVHDYPRPLCLAAPGDTYVAYLRYGGYVRLDLHDHDAPFLASFVNPATGEETEPRIVEGGAIRAFRAPGGYPGNEHYSDWVLWVRTR